MLRLPSGITEADSTSFESTHIEDKSGGINAYLSDRGDHKSDYITGNYKTLASTSISNNDSTTINYPVGKSCPDCLLAPF